MVLTVSNDEPLVDGETDEQRQQHEEPKLIIVDTS
jgi:hypothetical protein